MVEVFYMVRYKPPLHRYYIMELVYTQYYNV